MKNNKNKHDRHSIRLKNYDYSQFGAYFVTVCVRGHKCVLGKIISREIKLTEAGEIAQKSWLEIPHHFPNTNLDAFIVMPNHIHGIIIINTVGACHGMPLQNKFSKPISGSLATIINQYKSSVKRQCNKGNFSYFQWQRNYYEHVVRDEKDLNEIREYIVNNYLKWDSPREMALY